MAFFARKFNLGFLISTLRNIYPYLYLLFVFALPLDKYAPAAPNIILLTLIATFPFVVKAENFKILQKKEVAIFVVLIAYAILNSLLFHDFIEDKKVIQKIASSLLPLLLFIPIKSTRNLKITFIISVVGCILYSFFQIYRYYIDTGAYNFSSGEIINEILILERLYLGFICVLSIVLSVGLFRKGNLGHNKWLYLNIILCSVFVFLVVSRIAIILIVILFCLQIFYSKHTKKFALAFFCFLAFAALAFFINDNLTQRFFYSQSTQPDKNYFELLKQWEPRFVIWDCSYDIIKTENISAIGLGFNKTNDFLVSCYEEVVKPAPRRNYFIRRKFNTHNQYVDFWLSVGLVGTLIFLYLLVTMFLRNRKLFFQTALIISIVLFSGVENIFHRQLGAYLFGLILVFLINENKEIEFD